MSAHAVCGVLAPGARAVYMQFGVETPSLQQEPGRPAFSLNTRCVILDFHVLPVRGIRSSQVMKRKDKRIGKIVLIKEAGAQ